MANLSLKDFYNILPGELTENAARAMLLDTCEEAQININWIFDNEGTNRDFHIARAAGASRIAAACLVQRHNRHAILTILGCDQSDAMIAARE